MNKPGLTAHLDGPVIDALKRNAFEHLQNEGLRGQAFRDEFARVVVSRRCEAPDEVLCVVEKCGYVQEYIFLTTDVAYKRGLIGPWEYRWRKSKRSVGTLMRNAISGVLSALRTLGTRKTERR